MEKVRWGIVGAGRIAVTFADDIKLVDNAELVGVAARQLDNAKAFADKHQIANAYDGYQALFDDPSIDAVYIATPHNFHLQNAVDAMAAGKAVLCEKPLTANAEECRRLIAAAAENSCYLMEAMWTWFLPAIRKALEWVEEGRIGALKHIKADFGYPLPYNPELREYHKDLAGGALLEMGVYPVALAELFMGESPQRIRAIGRQAPNGVTDDLVFTFNYRDCVATLGTSFRCKLQNWAYIIGEDGYIAIPDFWRASQCHLYRLDERILSYQDHRTSNGFNFEIAAACDDILAGRLQSRVIPLETSLNIQAHMDQVRELGNA